MTWTSLLTNEQVLTAIAGVFGAIWTWFKAKEIRHRLEGKHAEIALRALELGVQYAWENYVRELKQAKPDGKLSRTERKEAKNRALKFAIEYAKSKKVDLVKEIGERFLEYAIDNAVAHMKLSKAGKIRLR